jgi:GNAT superfamily N-acetyltransferase
MTSGSNQNLLPDINIRNNFQYGDMGKVLLLHGKVYYQEYGFNHEFEAYVAEGLAEFANKYKPGKSCIWIAEDKGTIVGSIAILERENNHAQLRWFIVHPGYRGIALGKRLFGEALKFCQAAGYKKIFLWTLDNLAAARTIYETNGFKLVEKKDNYLWGHNLVEEYYVLNLR